MEARGRTYGEAMAIKREVDRGGSCPARTLAPTSPSDGLGGVRRCAPTVARERPCSGRPPFDARLPPPVRRTRAPLDHFSRLDGPIATALPAAPRDDRCTALDGRFKRDGTDGCAEDAARRHGQSKI